MKMFENDEVEPGTGVGPANLSLPNETAKCDPQLRSGLASSSQETNFSETLSLFFFFRADVMKIR